MIIFMYFRGVGSTEIYSEGVYQCADKLRSGAHATDAWRLLRGSGHMLLQKILRL